ncbi:MAG: endolytic transglycosylase MltG, partial [Bacteroidaceae bacterium]|nr:endolytic transglycosylase MltG [Bacteroidaceae bacterium]
LHKGMKLQSDPTVIFAMQDFTIRRVTYTMLNHPSPYNTYLHEGLPPGPIRIPSAQGLDAVLNYERNNYIYMCAKEDFSGSHNFTANSSEHSANARRYQQALNRKGIKK